MQPANSVNETALPHILLVDDEPSVCLALSRALLHTSAKYPVPIAASVTAAHTIQAALDLMTVVQPEPESESDSHPESPTDRIVANEDVTSARQSAPRFDLLLVDMCLGGESGLDLIRLLKERFLAEDSQARAALPAADFVNGFAQVESGRRRPRTQQPERQLSEAQLGWRAEAFESIGLLLLTGRATPEQMAQSIRLGVDDLLLKPVTLQTLRDAVSRCHQRLLQRRSQITQLREFAEELLLLRGRSEESTRSFADLQSAVLEALLAALAVREPGSVEHSLRVQTYTAFFARMINYPQTLRPQLEHAALLHDIGKIGISDMLLFRPDSLAPSELERMHPHALLGEQILGRIPFLRSAALIVRHHHEHYDGCGYPDGLAGEAIPLGSRIFAMMDALDALTTERPYRPAGTFADARDEILSCAGGQFDPMLCAQFARIPVLSWQEISHRVAERLHAREPVLAADLTVPRTHAGKAICQKSLS